MAKYTIGKVKIDYTLPQATETQLGGIKAKPKEEADTQEVHIDINTGILYTKPSRGGKLVVQSDFNGNIILASENFSYNVTDDSNGNVVLG